MDICPNYCGVSCVDGSCPMALSEEYVERGCDVIRDCNECIYYKGCADCCSHSTEICDMEK